MIYEKLFEELCHMVPELQVIYTKEMTGYEGEGQHILFGDFVNPFLEDLLQEDDWLKNCKILCKIFDFFEPWQSVRMFEFETC